MRSRSRGGKAILVVATVALLALAIGLAGPASAVPFNQATFSGYATGNVLFAGALQTDVGTPDELKILNVAEAFSGAGVDSAGLKAYHNEMNRLAVPASAKNSYGRGSGLELGVAKGPDEPNELQLQIAETSAPPDSTAFEDLLGPLQASPLAYASALRGEANANWSDSAVCVLGEDLSNGFGLAADLQLLETGETDPNSGKLGAPLVATDADPEKPERSVAWSKSRTYLSPQTGPNALPGKFGLTSEVRMTLAPITLGDALTIEFLGEWVLRATAGGVAGSSSVHYGPGDVSPQTHVLRIISGEDVPLELTLQDILGDTGLTPPPIPGVLELAIGEDPRAIDGDVDSAPTVTATSASGAVDVVRIKLADGQIADIRLGHMEATSKVPAGGIDCGIPVFKSASPKGVTVNQNFVVTIKIDNPFGCDLNAVRVEDVITTSGDAKFQVVDTNPNADTVPAGSNLDKGTIVWKNIGTIPKGGTKSVTATIKAQGGGGIIKDVAHVSAVAGNCEGEGDGNQLVGLSKPLSVPVVLKLKLPPTGVGTSTATMIGALALLSLAGVGIRQLRRSH